MKLWARERDLLVEQTLAFVEGITGSASPLRAALAMPAGASPAPVQLVPARVLDIVSQSPTPPRKAELAPKPIVVTLPADPQPALRSAPATFAPAAPLAVRDEIAQRVAAFKARQARFQSERARQCDEIFARALKTSRNQVTH